MATCPDPCSCISTCNPSDPPTSTPTCECLNLPYITVFPEDSVGPCGSTGVVSFTDCFDFCACENEVATLSVLDINPPLAVTINSINTAGMSFTTNDDVVDAYDKVEVTIKATCTDKDDENVQIGDHTIITIWIKDPCLGIDCETGEICECGECVEDNTANLTVS